MREIGFGGCTRSMIDFVTGRGFLVRCVCALRRWWCGGECTRLLLRFCRRLPLVRSFVRVSGTLPALTSPVIIEIEPRENIAAGRFGWGLGPWALAGTVYRLDVHGAGLPTGPEAAAGILEAAAGRSLVVVIRDAHRDAAAQSLVRALLAARPDAVLVEMGLPLWQPPEGTSYLVTYGASRASAQAAAELLGLALRATGLVAPRAR